MNAHDRLDVSHFLQSTSLNKPVLFECSNLILVVWKIFDRSKQAHERMIMHEHPENCNPNFLLSMQSI